MGAVAYLKRECPYFGLFPAGIPIISTDPVEVAVPGSTEMGIAYMVDWTALNNDQKIDLAEVCTEHRGTAPIFLKYMHDGGTLPLPVNEVDGVVESEPPTAA
jgi:hypothetical protein